MQWVLTENEKTIIDALDPFYSGPKTVLDLAQIANNYLYNFSLIDPGKEFQTSVLNIFMVDNFYQSPGKTFIYFLIYLFFLFFNFILFYLFIFLFF